MSYILITGASSGLGWQFAEQLAAQGHDIIITARRTDRLNQLALKLREQHEVKVEVISADLASTGAQHIVQTILENQWSLSGLINNAGFGVFGEFNQMSWPTQQDLIHVNILSLVNLTYHLIPLLQQYPQSTICNVASIASFQAGPGAALYYASKAFVLSFSEALSVELKPHNIQVSCLCPGVTVTEFFKTSSGKVISKYHAIAMTAESVVKIAIKNLHRPIVITGFRNKLLSAFSRSLPRALTRRFAAVFNRGK